MGDFGTCIFVLTAHHTPHTTPPLHPNPPPEPHSHPAPHPAPRNTTPHRGNRTSVRGPVVRRKPHPRAWPVIWKNRTPKVGPLHGENQSPEPGLLYRENQTPELGPLGEPVKFCMCKHVRRSYSQPVEGPDGARRKNSYLKNLHLQYAPDWPIGCILKCKLP